MAPTFAVFIILGMIAVLLVPGVVLVALALRGRLVRVEPCCAACSQRVGAHEVLESGRCPECGSELGGVGRVRFFARRVRPVMLVIGVLLALLAMVAPAAIAATVRTGGARPATLAMTTPALIGELEGRPAPLHGMVIAELSRRFTRLATVGGPSATASTAATADALPTQEDFDRFVRVIAAMPRSDPRLVNIGIAEVLATGRGLGMLSPAQIEALAGAWLDPIALLGVRAVVREGAQLRLGGRSHGDETPLLCRGWVSSTLEGGAPIRLDSWGPSQGEWIDLAFGANASIDLPPGEHALTATVRREVEFRTGTNAPVPGTPPGQRTNLLLADEVPVTIPIRVVARDAPSFVELHAPAARAPEVRDACQVRAVAIDDAGGAECLLHADISLGPVMDLHCSFEPMVVIDGREHALGWIHGHATANRSSTRSSLGAVRIPCPAAVPDRVTVILRPAPKRVEDDPSADRIWGEPVVIEGVPVRSTRRAPAAAPEP